MSELRKDPVTRRWVIVATERAKRPNQLHSKNPVTPPDLPDKDPKCPFCEGNEDMTPPEVAAYRNAGTHRDAPGWWIRVIPNKYSALDPDTPLERRGQGMYDMSTGFGVHEVIVESPRHNHTWATATEKEFEEIFWAYRDRLIALGRNPSLRYVLIFKNYGAEAGASQVHGHSQLIGLPVVPKRVLEEMEGSSDYFRYKERCPFCDVIRQEKADETRVIHENEHFIALAPYASHLPFQMTILPKAHSPQFERIEKHEIMELARLFRRVFWALSEVLGDPPFNCVLHTTPDSAGGDAHCNHWHFEIVPRLTKLAGFEWGSGFYINIAKPEDAAQALREKISECDLATCPSEARSPKARP
ncbi:MAG: galactose-1-phosphate uridylyltransferase [Firmicutes bacterium]|jgi:UDPglucose--hexose-1-phosphate uridylyltransferase|nr:galactose-1-phosphate uridylyltransferase [Bacillota bacterium]